MNAATSEAALQRGVAGARISRKQLRLALRYGLIALGALALMIGGIAYWLSGGRYIETEDAYVQANVLNVTTDVSGLVDQIYVHEGEVVKQGQVLFRLDPTQFQLAMDQAQANLDQTVLQLNSLKADYLTAQRQVIAQQARVTRIALPISATPVWSRTMP